MRKKGWSEEEISHLKRILSRVRKSKRPRIRLLEHAGFWIVVLLLAVGALGFVLQVLPFIILATPALNIPMLFLVGACLGLLLVHVVHDLRLGNTHHHLGAALMVVIAAALLWVVLRAVETRLAVLDASLAFHPWIMVLPIVAGMILPYVVHWRFIDGSA